MSFSDLHPEYENLTPPTNIEAVKTDILHDIDMKLRLNGSAVRSVTNYLGENNEILAKLSDEDKDEIVRTLSRSGKFTDELARQLVFGIES